MNLLFSYFGLELWQFIAIIAAIVVALIIIICIICACVNAKKRKAEKSAEPVKATETPVAEDPVEEEAAATSLAAEPVKEEVKPAETVSAKPAATAPAAKPATKPAEKESAKVYHIAKRKEDGRWQIKAQGATRAIKLFNTQAEAIAYAKQLAQNQEARIMIHKEDGSFRKLTY